MGTSDGGDGLPVINPSPRPRDIWTRLATRDIHCEVAMHSFDLPEADGRMIRNWEVTIRRKDDFAVKEFIRFTGPSLDHVMTQALDQADALGWPGAS